MKNFLAPLISIICLSNVSLLSQPCWGDVSLSTQGQVDSFQINYPGCTIIEGDLEIGGLDIINLNGLSVITNIGRGRMTINNTSLTNLSGLESLGSIGGYLSISNNDLLTNLTGLGALNTIGGEFYVQYNDALTTLMGLNSLSLIGQHLNIGHNSALTNFAGLESLSTIEGEVNIFSNNSLINLTGLESLAYVGSFINIYSNYSLINLTGLEGLNSVDAPISIHHNNSLTNLSGLESLAFIGGLSIHSNNSLYSLSGLGAPMYINGNITITNNSTLSTCEVESICDYFDYGNPTIIGNSTGCNSTDEVQSACCATTYDDDGDEFTECEGDCDDINPSIHPEATEICNGVDDDCNGIIDFPIPLTFTLTKPSCAGEMGSIKVNPPAPISNYSFLWSNSANTQIINVSAGMYTVTVTKTSTGCTTVSTTLLTAPPPLIITNVVVTNVKCFGQNTGTAKINVSGGTGGRTYLWSNGATTRIVNNLPAGVYSVSVTDLKGCMTTATAVITQPASPLVLNYTVSGPVGGKYKMTLSANGGTPYDPPNSYRFCKVSPSGSCVFKNISMYSGLLPSSTYEFRTRDKNFCQTIAVITIPENHALQQRGDGANKRHIVDEMAKHVFEKMEIGIVPNPFNENIIVSFDSDDVPELLTVRVFDLVGRQLSEKTWPTDTGIFEIQSLEWPTGVYQIQVSNNTDGTIRVLQVVKQ